jgi:hypothetical protein
MLNCLWFHTLSASGIGDWRQDLERCDLLADAPHDGVLVEIGMQGAPADLRAGGRTGVDERR